MKIETRKELVTTEIEVNTFIADDGMKFETALACDKYEKALAESNLRRKLDGIEMCKAAFGFTPLDGGEYYHNHDYVWYRPKTGEEIKILDKYFSLDQYISDEDIGSWLCIESYDLDEPGESSYSMRLKNTLQHIPLMLRAFGYDVTITKRNEQ